MWICPEGPQFFCAQRLKLPSKCPEMSHYYLPQPLIVSRYPQPDGGDDTGAALRDGQMSRVLG